MNTSAIKLVGIYPYEEAKNIYLIELIINTPPSTVDLSLFLQKDDSLPVCDWQAAYDERYLCLDGTEVIGDFFNRKKLNDTRTRVVFFMYLESLSNPLSTPYGDIVFCPPVKMPYRLKQIITYNPMD